MLCVKFIAAALLAFIAAVRLVPCRADKPAAPQANPLEWIRVSPDETHFVADQSGHKFGIWGVNYDHDDA